MKKFIILAMLAASLAPLAGCIIAPRGPHRHWQSGYYDHGPSGGYHPGYWG